MAVVCRLYSRIGLGRQRYQGQLFPWRYLQYTTIDVLLRKLGLSEIRTNNFPWSRSSGKEKDPCKRQESEKTV